MEDIAVKEKDSTPNFLQQQDKNTVAPLDTVPDETEKSESTELVEYTDNNDVVKEIVNVNTNTVSSIIMGVDKISLTAFSIKKNIALYQGIARSIGMEPDGRPHVNTFISINFDFDKMDEKGLSIHGTEKLAPFDRIVLDAINTLYFVGHNEYITTSMVFHVMTGDKNKFMSPQYAEEINNSFIKLLFTHITIDATEEAVMYPSLKDFKYHSTILPGDMVQARLNGTEVACIHIYRKPILYLYAKHKKQISKLDLSLIQKPFANNKKESKEQMLLLYYILRRIIALKSISNVMKYETIYKEFGYEKASSKNKFDLRKRVKAILDEWKGLTFGDIQFIDYTETKDVNTPYAIVLHYSVIKNTAPQNDQERVS